jgi:hypothetical protein
MHEFCDLHHSGFSVLAGRRDLSRCCPDLDYGCAQAIYLGEGRARLGWRVPGAREREFVLPERMRDFANRPSEEQSSDADS